MYFSTDLELLWMFGSPDNLEIKDEIEIPHAVDATDLIIVKNYVKFDYECKVEWGDGKPRVKFVQTLIESLFPDVSDTNNNLVNTLRTCVYCR